jgi:hypothetical protein
VQLNFAAREVTLKLVYYGPALSGKTTNMHALHRLMNEDCRGRLMTLDTRDDRTLFFDMLPIVVRLDPTEPGAPPDSASGMSVRVKVFTVPGQVVHAATRKLVLQGADGVAFIADSQTSETGNNAASFLDLRANLKELGISTRAMPLVIQFNKRDLPNARPAAELDALAKRGREPVYAATALTGQGVLETFFCLLQLAWTKLEAEHQLARSIGIAPGAFVPTAARKLGIAADVNQLIAASLGGAGAGAR